MNVQVATRIKIQKKQNGHWCELPARMGALELTIALVLFLGSAKDLFQSIPALKAARNSGGSLVFNAFGVLVALSVLLFSIAAMLWLKYGKQIVEVNKSYILLRKDLLGFQNQRLLQMAKMDLPFSEETVDGKFFGKSFALWGNRKFRVRCERNGYSYTLCNGLTEKEAEDIVTAILPYFPEPEDPSLAKDDAKSAP